MQIGLEMIVRMLLSRLLIASCAKKINYDIIVCLFGGSRKDGKTAKRRQYE